MHKAQGMRLTPYPLCLKVRKQASNLFTLLEKNMAIKSLVETNFKEKTYYWLCARIRHSPTGYIVQNKTVITIANPNPSDVALLYAWDRYGRKSTRATRKADETTPLDSRGFYYYADKCISTFDLLIRVSPIDENEVVDLDDIEIPDISINGVFENVRYW